MPWKWSHVLGLSCPVNFLLHSSSTYQQDLKLLKLLHLTQHITNSEKELHSFLTENHGLGFVGAESHLLSHSDVNCLVKATGLGLMIISQPDNIIYKRQGWKPDTTKPDLLYPLAQRELRCLEILSQWQKTAQTQSNSHLQWNLISALRTKLSLHLYWHWVAHSNRSFWSPSQQKALRDTVKHNAVISMSIKHM